MRNEAQNLPMEDDATPASEKRPKSMEEIERMLKAEEAERNAEKEQAKQEELEANLPAGDRFMADAAAYAELAKKIANKKEEISSASSKFPPEASNALKSELATLTANQNKVVEGYGAEAGVFKHDADQLIDLRAKIDQRKKEIRDFESRTSMSTNEAKQNVHGDLYDKMAASIVGMERSYDEFANKLKGNYDTNESNDREAMREPLTTAEIDSALGSFDKMIAEDDETIEVTDEMMAEGGTAPVESKSKVGESRIDNLTKKLEPIANELAVKFGVSDAVGALAERSKKGKVSRFFGGLFNRKESLLNDFDKLSNEIADLQAKENEDANRDSADPAKRARYQQGLASKGRGGWNMGSKNDRK